MDHVEDYFWKKPTEIHNFYNFKVLGYANMASAAVGLVFNIFITLVLTRKHMVSPMNTIFIHYIVTETIAGISYMPRTYHEFFRVESCSIQEHNTYTWETISYYSYYLAFLFRHIGIWMSVMMAVWRYVAVIHPLKERQYYNMETTQKLILGGYVFVILMSIPPFLAVGVGPAVKLLDQNGCVTTNVTIGKNVTIYQFQIFLEDYLFWYTLGLFSYSILIKLLPSLIMCIISLRLINNIMEARRLRKEMVSISKRKNTYNSRMKHQIRKQTDRTTKIILIILALFILGEVPNGIFAFLTGCYGPKFFWKYFYYGMEVFNSLTIVSESFIFLVYYSMSKQFRTTFKSLFISNSNSRIVTPQRSSSSFTDINKSLDESIPTTRSSSITAVSSSCK